MRREHDDGTAIDLRAGDSARPSLPPPPCQHSLRCPRMRARCFDGDPICSTNRKINCTQRRKTCPNIKQPPTCQDVCPLSRAKNLTECQDDTCPYSDWNDSGDDEYEVIDCCTQTRFSSYNNRKKNICKTQDCSAMTEPCLPMVAKSTITARPCPLSSSSCCDAPQEQNPVCRKSSKKIKKLIPCFSQTEKTCFDAPEVSVCTATDKLIAEECTSTSCDVINQTVQVCLPPYSGDIVPCQQACASAGTMTRDERTCIEPTRSSCASCNTESITTTTSCSASRKSVSFEMSSCCLSNSRKRSGPNFTFYNDINNCKNHSDQYVEDDDDNQNEITACLCSKKDDEGNAEKCMSCSQEDKVVCICGKGNTSADNVQMQPPIYSYCSFLSKKNSAKEKQKDKVREKGREQALEKGKENGKEKKENGKDKKSLETCCCKAKSKDPKVVAKCECTEADGCKDEESNNCACVYPPAYRQYCCTGKLSGRCPCTSYDIV